MNTIGLLGMSGKPVHEGHWKLIEYASKNCDTLKLFVSTADRKRKGEIAIKGNTMQFIWNTILRNHLPENCELTMSKMPIKDVADYIMSAHDENIYIFSGEDDIEKYKTFPNYLNDDCTLEVKPVNRNDSNLTVNVSGTRMREFLANDDYESFISYLPDCLSDKEKEEYWELLSNDMNGNLITESSIGRNTHSTHIEDVIFNFNLNGIDTAIDIINDFIDFSEKKNEGYLSLKIDGAPAIIFGTDPQTNKFFIGTKGVFAKTPKICFSDEDIEQMYSGKTDLIKKVKLAFDCLSKLGIKEVYQADFLYDKDDLITENINGKDYIVFTPNTITYGVLSDSENGKAIMKSKMGMSVHTKYTNGSSLAEMKNEQCKEFPYQSNEIWNMNNKVVSEGNVDESQLRELNTIKDELGEYKNKIKEEKFSENFTAFMETYLNYLVKNDIEKIDTKSVKNDLIKWTKEKFDKVIEGFKTEESKTKKREECDKLINYIEGLDLESYFGAYNLVREAKEVMMNILDKSNNGVMTFFKNGDEYVPTTHEGYATQKYNFPIKLVNRSGFSRQNFRNDKFRKGE